MYVSSKRVFMCVCVCTLYVCEYVCEMHACVRVRVREVCVGVVYVRSCESNTSKLPVYVRERVILCVFESVCLMCEGGL